MTRLNRVLSLPVLTFYGLGTILGAGIYVLLGAVSGQAAQFLPISFLLAAVIAAFTAFSYAELVARLPRSGGEAVYVEAAFHSRSVTRFVGYAAAMVGIISAATISSGFAGYARVFLPDVNGLVVITMFVLVLGSIAAIHIQASASTAAGMTIIESVGLLMIIYVGSGTAIDYVATDWHRLIPTQPDQWSGVAAGAFLAFYAFLGFEDIVNVAEEVKHPERNLPRAIIISLVVATLLYLLVGLVAITSLPMATLTGSDAPLAAVAEVYGISVRFMSAIALIAIGNGALIQIIKSSRLLYGLATLGDAPPSFGTVNLRTGTPLVATVTISLIVLVLALSLGTADLAAITSLVTLTIFAIVNFALLVLKRRDRDRIATMSVPSIVPASGMALSLLLIALQLF